MYDRRSAEQSSQPWRLREIQQPYPIPDHSLETIMQTVEQELADAWERILRLDQQVQSLRQKNQQLVQELVDYKALVNSQLTKLKVALG